MRLVAHEPNEDALERRLDRIPYDLSCNPDPRCSISRRPMDEEQTQNIWPDIALFPKQVWCSPWGQWDSKWTMGKFIIFVTMLHSLPKWSGVDPETSGSKLIIIGPRLHSFPKWDGSGPGTNGSLCGLSYGLEPRCSISRRPKGDKQLHVALFPNGMVQALGPMGHDVT